MIRTQAPKLPVGGKPGWELDDGEEESKLRRVADSFVVLQSLRQSRARWLTSTFPKFSSKSRGGKQPDIVPPPHTIQSRGRCDLQIGPHIFLDTTVFEAHYSSSQPSVPAPSQPAYLYYPSTSHTPWPVTTPVNVAPHTYSQAISTTTISTTTMPATSQPLVEASSSNRSNSPLLSSLASSVSITPELISQVNNAAASNPTLANLLQTAAAGRATPDQLKTLGILIQSLATSPHLVSHDIAQTLSPAPTGGYQSSPVSIKPFDIVIEFREAPHDRWVLPRIPAVCEQVPNAWNPSAISDILLSTWLPFDQDSANHNVALDEENMPLPKRTRHLVTFRLTRASVTICDTLIRWIGGKEQMEENRQILKDLEPHDEVFLRHRLPEGSLLTQVQNAAIPPFNTKSIQPAQGEITKAKRKPAPRKLPSNPATASRRVSTTPPPPKKRRQTQSKVATPLPKIACFTCGQTDVPLIMGGRFCRPCVEAGKATNDIPPAGNLKYHYAPSSSATDSSQAPSAVTSVPQPSYAVHFRQSSDLSAKTFSPSPLVNPPLYPEKEDSSRNNDTNSSVAR